MQQRRAPHKTLEKLPADYLLNQHREKKHIKKLKIEQQQQTQHRTTNKNNAWATKQQ